MKGQSGRGRGFEGAWFTEGRGFVKMGWGFCRGGGASKEFQWERGN